MKNNFQVQSSLQDRGKSVRYYGSSARAHWLLVARPGTMPGLILHLYSVRRPEHLRQNKQIRLELINVFVLYILFILASLRYGCPLPTQTHCTWPLSTVHLYCKWLLGAWNRCRLININWFGQRSGINSFPFFSSLNNKIKNQD